MKRDIDWLRKSLAAALGWDEQLTEGVAEAIAAAGSKHEVDELTQDYLGGSDKVQTIIRQFLGEDKAKAASKGYVELHGGSTRQGTASSRPAGNMTIIHKADKRKGAAPAKAVAPEMDRTVANCLCCGKVYDCRESSSNDVKLFVDMGGVCTFCGAKVSLSNSGTSEIRPSAAERLSKANPAMSSSPEPLPASSADSESTAVAEARAFKDRLVDYDRNAAKRTNVIDDQSDFFEIDSNAWLSDEERAQLKERERAMQEAEQARKRAVRVTIDLLGRQVIMADDAAEPGPSDAHNAQLAASAAAAAAAEIPQGGGTSVRAAAAAAAGLQAEDSAAPASRIQANPFLKGPAPTFVPRAGNPSTGAGKASAAVSKAGAASSASAQQRPRKSAAESGRLQHDDPFSLEPT